MTTLSVRLPNSLHKAAREIAEEEDTSINQLVASALAEKISALRTVDYLRQRGAQGSIEDFRTLMAKIPAIEPDPYDRLE
jgi:hypothetical protein